MRASFPPNENERIAKLLSYNILDTGYELVYDDLTALASQICNTPISLVNLIDVDRQWSKSNVGLDATEMSRDAAFCAHAILDQHILIIPDTTQDPRFADNPLVTGAPHIRFYAGAPLVTPDGFALGTLCVIDLVPRNLTSEQIQALQVLSRQVVSQLELKLSLTSLSHKMTELSRVNDELRQSEAKNRAILSAIPDLIMLICADGTFLEVIQSNYLFDLIPKSHNRVGQNLYEVLPHSIADLEMQAIHRALSTQTIQIYEQEVWINEQLQHEEVRVVPYDTDIALLTIRNISDRKQLEIQLQRSQDQLHSILTHSPVAIFAKDLDGRYTFINRFIETLFQTSQAEWIGKTDADLMAPDIAHPLRANDERVLSHGTPIWLEETLFIDGERRYFLAVKFPLMNEQHEPYAICGISTDITERKQFELELKQAKDVAEAANRAKSEFLANMSHELRTPLNAILGFAQVMNLDSTVSPNHAECLKIILDSGNHLLSLINSVLDLSKIEAGRMSLVHKKFDLVELLTAIHGMLYQQAIAKMLHFDINLAPDLPRTIYGDQQKLRQVLINLISNSIKFTQDGGVTVKVSVINDETGHSLPPIAKLPQDDRNLTLHSGDKKVVMLCFEIEDTGIGIAVSDQTRIFEAFEQTEQSKGALNGTGLGLTLSQRMVHLMKGSISLESEVDKGTNFTLNIPVELATTDQPALSKPNHIKLAPDQSHWRILVVDDQLENRKILVNLLTKVGFDVQEAVDGKTAVRAWWRWHPHLVLMDMRMPVIDGYEATRRIRALEQFRGRHEEIAPIDGQSSDYATDSESTKIVALTASAFDEQRSKIFDAGCDGIIHKPFQADQLFDAIAKYLGVNYVYSPSPISTDIDNSNNTDDIGLGIRDASSEPRVIHPSELDVMPPSWKTSFFWAVSRLSDTDCLKLIEHIPPRYAELSHSLAMLVDNFRFDILSTLNQDTTRHHDS
ncbi:MAG: PAS domain-containing protein [Elainellaceae cyanobacterium]